MKKLSKSSFHVISNFLFGTDAKHRSVNSKKKMKRMIFCKRGSRLMPDTVGGWILAAILLVIILGAIGYLASYLLGGLEFSEYFLRFGR